MKQNLTSRGVVRKYRADSGETHLKRSRSSKAHVIVIQVTQYTLNELARTVVIFPISLLLCHSFIKVFLCLNLIIFKHSGLMRKRLQSNGYILVIQDIDESVEICLKPSQGIIEGSNSR